MNSSLPLALGALLLLSAPRIFADAVTLAGGERKTGCILGVEKEEVILSAQPVPGLPSVELRLPKSRLVAMEFGENPQREEFLQSAGHAQLAEVAGLWERFSPLLSVPGSPGARIGLRYGLLLLGAHPPGGAPGALALFESIAAAAPTPAEREAATQGVLRALLAGGQWARAETEAGFLCKTASGTPLLAEARLTFGVVRTVRLREFLQENPRWQQDDFVRAERDRLYESALDHLLGAALLQGVPGELAARGLRMALEVFAQAGDLVRTRAIAEDLVVFHPGTMEARYAVEWLQANPEQAQPKLK
jgi:hypothetical protein